MTQINHGTVESVGTGSSPAWLAKSNLEEQEGVFNTFNGASFFLWLIEARVMSQRQRNSAAQP